MGKVTEKAQKWLPRTWSPNQVVAHNLTRARLLRGWTQDQAADALAPYLGVRLSLASFSAIERSIAGARVKQFSADDLVALSRAFQLPLGWWLTPPSEGTMYTPDHERTGVDFAELVDVVLGTPDTLPAWTDALENWAAGRAKPNDASGPGRGPSARAARQTDLRARTLVRERFGDLGEARDVLRRLADLVSELDDSTAADTTGHKAAESEAVKGAKGHGSARPKG
jgi:transcriptional regulator with XRE-family HTH domain